MPSPSASRTPSVAQRLLPAVLGREVSLFDADWQAHASAVRNLLAGRRVLVVGGAGSIGSAVVRQIVGFGPRRVVVVDVSENNLAELVRRIRSTPGLAFDGELVCDPLDFGSGLGLAAIREHGPYDVVLNFAALKHVRSEKNVFTLLNMLNTNVAKLARLLDVVGGDGCEMAFSVSSDKAVCPANLMGASKRMMERVLFAATGRGIGRVASTRFANVAFSDGSLLDSFLRRLDHGQPLAGPSDIERYFISSDEAGQLCLLAAATAANGQVYVPRASASLMPLGFMAIAEAVLNACGYQPAWYDSAAQARDAVPEALAAGRYPCCFTPSQTAGEKPIEQFVGPEERVDRQRFAQIDVVTSTPPPPPEQLADAVRRIERWAMWDTAPPSKDEVIELVQTVVPELSHQAAARQLDQQM